MEETWRDGLATERVAVAMVEKENAAAEQQKKMKQK